MHLGTNLGLGVVLAAILLTPATGLPVTDVSMIPPDGEGAKYWPRWRGPSGQSLAAGSGYVDKWSDTDNVKWKTTLDSKGRSRRMSRRM